MRTNDEYTQKKSSNHEQRGGIADQFIDDENGFYADEEAAGVDELLFDDEESGARIGDPLPRAEIERHQPPRRAREAGLTEASHPGDGVTADDASPEVLTPEDGANSPHEAGRGAPADRTFSRVAREEIGGGDGLDEAELARVKPLDGKAWDGKAEGGEKSDGKKWDGGQREF